MTSPGRSAALYAVAKVGVIAVAVIAVALLGVAGLWIALPAALVLALLILLGPGGMLD